MFPFIILECLLFVVTLASQKNPDHRMAALVSKEIVVVIPGLTTQIQVMPNPASFAYKHFTGAKPTKFYGLNCATTLLQWSEKMEL